MCSSSRIQDVKNEGKSRKDCLSDDQWHTLKISTQNSVVWLKLTMKQCLTLQKSLMFCYCYFASLYSCLVSTVGHSVSFRVHFTSPYGHFVSFSWCVYGHFESLYGRFKSLYTQFVSFFLSVFLSGHFANKIIIK